MDWSSVPFKYPRLFKCLILLKRYRTKIGLALFAYCFIEGLIEREIPFNLDELNIWVVSGLLLILAGLAFRLAAYGCIKKHEVLATSGVYSLCRHPLYLGSILLTMGFCCLLDDTENFVLAIVYFAMFYSVTIIWEEVRLAQRYGPAHQEYVQSTPLLLPFGRFRHGVFQWRRALSAGGWTLIGCTVFLLSAVEVMAEFMHRH